MRQVFENRIPRLKEINTNPAVGLDTMQDCVGHIMIERDRKVAELSGSSSGVLGRIRSRFMAQKGGDWNDTYMKGLDGQTFAISVAHTAHGASMRAKLSGRHDPDHMGEISFLADLAEAHAGPNRFQTSKMVSDTRANLRDIETCQPYARSFGQ